MVTQNAEASTSKFSIQNRLLWIALGALSYFIMIRGNWHLAAASIATLELITHALAIRISYVGVRVGSIGDKPWVDILEMCSELLIVAALYHWGWEGLALLRFLAAFFFFSTVLLQWNLRRSE